ncbi:MarR family winged helix-turn-helix transcriptional regulator [Pseudaquidulcibacter saccharophilus]|uniref:MarR family winged helix-turn-helix transcriptional regulator n=1 Tax=Pseudaquidulcibacter saccharophilus TaxID=2831900 RepID=UPI001EFF0D7C|nr:helix-turn-helix domain-containing protein [Pseudaquidulcibacter saccharophilus]
MDKISEFSLQVFELNGLFIGIGDAALKPLGITSAKWQVLGTASMGKAQLSVPHIAKLIGQSRQATQKTANDLVRLGLAEFHENEFHKKSKLFVPTQKGLDTHKLALEIWMKISNSIISQIAPDELLRAIKINDELIGILRKINGGNHDK